ncbi:neuropeptide Y receptor type 2 [Hydra vulgaris]|uniref:neuropeptide Y receptor type 2 n=1 Tax=Hydra vulgaris TaxID=6087 RepID=UPI00064166D5|nr:neuropeptide Y receptor type 2 [Hydra vulgaris]
MTQNSPILTFFEVGVNTFIIVGGVIGNIFILVLIAKRKSMHNITNYFVFNLALADLAISVIVIPLTMAHTLKYWKPRELECKIIMPILEHFAGVCVLTHTSLSIARHLIVSSRTNKQLVSLRYIVLIIVLIWLVAFLIISVGLMGVFANFILDHKKGCTLVFKGHGKVVYTVIVFVVTYIIPMTLTGFSYYRIHRTISINMTSLKNHMSKEIYNCRQRSSKRLDRILWTMYIFFGTTTLPLQAYYFADGLNIIPQWDHILKIWSLFISLFYLQVVTNPFVMLYMGSEYRRELFSCYFNHCIHKTSLKVKGSILGRGLGYIKKKPTRETNF